MPFDSIMQTDGELNLTTIDIEFAPFPPGPDDLHELLVTDPLGNVETFLTQPGGITPAPGDNRPRGRVDAMGNTTELTLDSSGRVATVTDRLGDETHLAYDLLSGKVQMRTDALGNQWVYQYQETDATLGFYDLSAIDYPDGTTESWTFDQAGNRLTHTDRAGAVTTRTYNGAGQVLTETNALGGVTTFAYNPDGTLASRTDPAGNMTGIVYDSAGRPTVITPPSTSSKGNPGDVTITYDADDNITALVDGTGAAQSFAYDANGNLISISNDLAQTIMLGYDGNDDLISITDPLGATTALGRDALGRLASRTDSTGTASQFAYDARGRIITTTDSLSNVQSFAYDDEGVLSSVTDALGNATDVATDRRGRPVSITNPLGNATTVSYNVLGRVITHTSPAGIASVLDYDDASRLTTLTRGGLVASYGRDGLGNIIQMTDPRGNSRSRSFDSSSRLTALTDAVGDSVALTYDARNRLATITAAGVTATNTFDQANRLTSTAYSDGTPTVTFDYDQVGRLTSATGVSIGYDAAGRINQSNGILLERDTAGRITRITLEPGITIDYAYDARGLPATITDWLAGVTTLSYDERGLLNEVTYPNGVVTTRQYDAAGRLIALETTLGMSEIGRSDITRDDDGRISESVQNYPLLDGFSNADQTFSYDAADRIAGFGYDSAGRQTDDTVNSFVWDGASRLIQIVPPAGFSTIEFDYDAFGQRLNRTEGGETTTYVWNYALALPSIAIIERPGGKRYYVHGPDGALLYEVDAGSDARTHYHFDETGSSRLLTDDAGAVIAGYLYGPYGEMIAESGDARTPFAWGGEFGVERDGPFYYMRARYFDPRAARFLSRDPLGENVFDIASLNLYGFARQNPISFSDPAGLEPVTDEFRQELLEGLRESVPEAIRAEFEDKLKAGLKITDPEELAEFISNELDPDESAFDRDLANSPFVEKSFSLPQADALGLLFGPLLRARVSARSTARVLLEAYEDRLVRQVYRERRENEARGTPRDSTPPTRADSQLNSPDPDDITEVIL